MNVFACAMHGIEVKVLSCIHGRQKLTLLHLFTNLFRKEIFPHSSEYLQGYYHVGKKPDKSSRALRERRSPTR